MLPDCCVVSVGDAVVVDDVMPDDGGAHALLVHLLGDGSPAPPRLSEDWWRIVDGEVGDDAGGHVPDDRALIVSVPPISSLPELLHDGKDVGIGGLVAPLPVFQQGRP